MVDVRGFPPLSDPDARILVLGTMPGAASLAAGQYYAHPRNAFWPVIEAVFAIPHGQDYTRRCAALTKCGVAVWDVLEACHRPGSLDADIDQATTTANDFATFFVDHANIHRVCFNGAMAEKLFHRHVEPQLPELDLEQVRLPSTSPAYAAMTLAEKVERWREWISVNRP